MPNRIHKFTTDQKISARNDQSKKIDVSLADLEVEIDEKTEDYESLEVQSLVQQLNKEPKFKKDNVYICEQLIQKSDKTTHEAILNQLKDLTNSTKVINYPAEIAFLFHGGAHWQVLGIKLYKDKTYEVHLFDSSTGTDVSGGHSQAIEAANIIEKALSSDYKILTFLSTKKRFYHKPYKQSGEKKDSTPGFTGNVVDERYDTNDCGVYAIQTIFNIAESGFDEAAKNKSPKETGTNLEEQAKARVALGAELRAEQAVKLAIYGSDQVGGIKNFDKVKEAVEKGKLPEKDYKVLIDKENLERIKEYHKDLCESSKASTDYLGSLIGLPNNQEDVKGKAGSFFYEKLLKKFNKKQEEEILGEDIASLSIDEFIELLIQARIEDYGDKHGGEFTETEKNILDKIYLSENKEFGSINKIRDDISNGRLVKLSKAIKEEKISTDFKTQGKVKLEVLRPDIASQGLKKHHFFYYSLNDIEAGENFKRVFESKKDDPSSCDKIKNFLDKSQKSSAKIKIGINSQDENGLTLLHYAVMNEDLEAVKFLIEQGADPSLKTKRYDNDSKEIELETPRQLVEEVLKKQENSIFRYIPVFLSSQPKQKTDNLKQIIDILEQAEKEANYSIRIESKSEKNTDISYFRGVKLSSEDNEIKLELGKNLKKIQEERKSEKAAKTPSEEGERKQKAIETLRRAIQRKKQKVTEKVTEILSVDESMGVVKTVKEESGEKTKIVVDKDRFKEIAIAYYFAGKKDKDEDEWTDDKRLTSDKKKELKIADETIETVREKTSNFCKVISFMALLEAEKIKGSRDKF